MNQPPAAIAVPAAEASADGGPSYAVTKRYADFELRQYAPYTVAEVTVPGPAEDVGSQGFKLLAAYIFGGNQGRRSIAMTSPVTNTAAPVRLAMTTPVTQSAAGAAGTEASGSGFIVQFTMPRGETLATLPTPNDARVRLREMPAQHYAAMTYSGRWTEANDNKHTEALRKALADAGLQTEGEEILARYNAPFVLPPLRRNEVWLRLAP